LSSSQTSSSPIDRLQDAIQAELKRDPKGPKVAQILAAYSKEQSDWKRFALFDAETYARNLVHRTDAYELIVVCWGLWQESPIHNHAGQNCWMAVLDGAVEEIHYELPGDDRRGRLAEGRTSVFQRGSVAFINDEIALHKVRPCAGLSGVTLHLYSRPIDVCNVYDSGTSQVVSRKMEYHSVAGSLTSA
jgi:cysteine dioxygenase